MIYSFLCLGSRGDVQPYIALGKALQRAGNTVRIATHSGFEPLVTQHGLQFAEVEGNPRDLIEGDAARKAMRSGGNPFLMARHFRAAGSPILQKMLHSSKSALAGSNVILYGVLGVAATHLAELWNIPSIALPLQPITPSRYTTATGFPDLPWLPFYNQLSWALARQTFSYMVAQPISHWRNTNLPLPKLNPHQQYTQMMQQGAPVIYGYSQHILPTPVDYPPSHRASGYWFLDEPAYQPPTALREFIEKGEPPLYFGFGSMNTGESQRSTAAILYAIKQLGKRAVLLRGWGGIHAQDLPPNVMLVDNVSHTWLFPRVAGIIHHAGAGTTAAAFRSGTPQLAMPHFADQPLWARRVHQLGVGPKPLPMDRLSPQALTHSLRQLLENQSYRTNANTLAGKINQEDGVATARDWIEQLVRQ